MKAILWNYRFADFKDSWRLQLIWAVNSLIKYGVEVKKHKDLICRGLEHLELYNPLTDNPSDIVLYNHTDNAHIIGNVVKSKVNWFFKPTVPDEWHTTLDELGYGPFSTITYQKPDFENVSDVEVNKFFETKVAEWKNLRKTKYGNYFKATEIDITDKDYFLVLGQCGGDEVVSKFDFGNYFSRLESIVKELVRISDRKIIVKLHPYTDGKDEKNTLYSTELKIRFEKISDKIKVFTGHSNVQNFIKNCYCVLLSNSGAGFEAMMYGKPIIAWGFPEYRWISYDLRHLMDLINAIDLNWFNLQKQRKFLYWYMEKYCFYDQKTTDTRVEELLKNVR